MTRRKQNTPKRLKDTDRPERGLANQQSVDSSLVTSDSAGEEDDDEEDEDTTSDEANTDDKHVAMRGVLPGLLDLGYDSRSRLQGKQELLEAHARAGIVNAKQRHIHSSKSQLCQHESQIRPPASSTDETNSSCHLKEKIRSLDSSSPDSSCHRKHRQMTRLPSPTVSPSPGLVLAGLDPKMALVMSSLPSGLLARTNGPPSPLKPTKTLPSLPAQGPQDDQPLDLSRRPVSSTDNTVTASRNHSSTEFIITRNTPYNSFSSLQSLQQRFGGSFPIGMSHKSPATTVIPLQASMINKSVFPASASPGQADAHHSTGLAQPRPGPCLDWLEKQEVPKTADVSPIYKGENCMRVSPLQADEPICEIGGKHTIHRCSCQKSFSSLFALSMHLQETGHTPGCSKASSLVDYRKLVRGQDIWLNQESEQTRRILRCMQCGESFKSLPLLTVHMMQTQHYTKIVSSDQGRRSHKCYSHCDRDMDKQCVFKCKVCHEAFIDMEGLANHMIVSGHHRKPSTRQVPNYPASAGDIASVSRQGKRKRYLPEDIKRALVSGNSSLTVASLLEYRQNQAVNERGGLYCDLNDVGGSRSPESSLVTCDSCGKRVQSHDFDCHVLACLRQRTQVIDALKSKLALEEALLSRSESKLQQSGFTLSSVSRHRSDAFPSCESQGRGSLSSRDQQGGCERVSSEHCRHIKSKIQSSDREHRPLSPEEPKQVVADSVGATNISHSLEVPLKKCYCSSDGSSEANSNVNGRQADSNVNGRQADSNVNRRQVDSNENSRHVDSNVNGRQADSSENSRHVDSNVNGRQADSNENSRHVDSNVNGRQADSNENRRQVDRENSRQVDKLSSTSTRRAMSLNSYGPLINSSSSVSYLSIKQEGVSPDLSSQIHLRPSHEGVSPDLSSQIHLRPSDEGVSPDLSSQIQLRPSHEGVSPDLSSQIQLRPSHEGVSPDLSSQIQLRPSHEGVSSDLSSQIQLRPSDEGVSPDLSSQIQLRPSHEGVSSDLSSQIQLRPSHEGVSSDLSSQIQLRPSDEGVSPDLSSQIQLRPSHEGVSSDLSSQIQLRPSHEGGDNRRTPSETVLASDGFRNVAERHQSPNIVQESAAESLDLTYSALQKLDMFSRGLRLSPPRRKLSPNSSRLSPPKRKLSPDSSRRQHHHLAKLQRKREPALSKTRSPLLAPSSPLSQLNSPDSSKQDVTFDIIDPNSGSQDVDSTSSALEAMESFINKSFSVRTDIHSSNLASMFSPFRSCFPLVLGSLAGSSGASPDRSDEAQSHFAKFSRFFRMMPVTHSFSDMATDHSADTNRGSDHSAHTNRGSDHSAHTNRGSDHSAHTNRGSDHSAHTNRGSDHSADTNRGSDHSADTNRGSDHSAHTNRGSDHSAHTNRGSDHSAHTNRASDHSAHTNRGSDHSAHTNRGSDHSAHTNRASDHSAQNHSAHTNRGSDHSAHTNRASDHSAHTNRASDHSAHTNRASDHSAHTNRASDHSAHTNRASDHSAHTNRASDHSAHTNRTTEKNMKPGLPNNKLQRTTSSPCERHQGTSSNDTTIVLNKKTLRTTLSSLPVPQSPLHRPGVTSYRDSHKPSHEKKVTSAAFSRKYKYSLERLHDANISRTISQTLSQSTDNEGAWADSLGNQSEDNLSSRVSGLAPVSSLEMLTLAMKRKRKHQINLDLQTGNSKRPGMNWLVVTQDGADDEIRPDEKSADSKRVDIKAEPTDEEKDTYQNETMYPHKEMVASGKFTLPPVMCQRGICTKLLTNGRKPDQVKRELKDNEDCDNGADDDSNEGVNNCDNFIRETERDERRRDLPMGEAQGQQSNHPGEAGEEAQGQQGNHPGEAVEEAQGQQGNHPGEAVEEAQGQQGNHPGEAVGEAQGQQGNHPGEAVEEAQGQQGNHPGEAGEEAQGQQSNHPGEAVGEVGKNGTSDGADICGLEVLTIWCAGDVGTGSSDTLKLVVHAQAGKEELMSSCVSSNDERMGDLPGSCPTSVHVQAERMEDLPGSCPTSVHVQAERMEDLPGSCSTSVHVQAERMEDLLGSCPTSVHVQAERMEDLPGSCSTSVHVQAERMEDLLGSCPTSVHVQAERMEDLPGSCPTSVHVQAERMEDLPGSCPTSVHVQAERMEDLPGSCPTSVHVQAERMEDLPGSCPTSVHVQAERMEDLPGSCATSIQTGNENNPISSCGTNGQADITRSCKFSPQHNTLRKRTFSNRVDSGSSCDDDDVCTDEVADGCMDKTRSPKVRRCRETMKYTTKEVNLQTEGAYDSDGVRKLCDKQMMASGNENERREDNYANDCGNYANDCGNSWINSRNEITSKDMHSQRKEVVVGCGGDCDVANGQDSLGGELQNQITPEHFCDDEILKSPRRESKQVSFGLHDKLSPEASPSCGNSQIVDSYQDVTIEVAPPNNVRYLPDCPLGTNVSDKQRIRKSALDSLSLFVYNQPLTIEDPLGGQRRLLSTADLTHLPVDADRHAPATSYRCVTPDLSTSQNATSKGGCCLNVKDDDACLTEEHASEGDLREYKCCACGRRFASKGSYRYHLSRCHLTSVNKYGMKDALDTSPYVYLPLDHTTKFSKYYQMTQELANSTLYGDSTVGK